MSHLPEHAGLRGLRLGGFSRLLRPHALWWLAGLSFLSLMLLLSGVTQGSLPVPASAIGRALLARPKLLLLDEPSLGLAPLVVENIFEIIEQINKDGVTVLLVEQNAQMALQIAHRGYVLETGRVTLEGPASDLLSNPKVRSAYLGLD